MKKQLKLPRPHIYEILFVFLVSGVIGWVYETIVESIHAGGFTARGIIMFLEINGVTIIWGFPFILVYALGGIMLVTIFRSLVNHPWRLFFIGMAAMTFFELLTSYFCEYILHQTLWVYPPSWITFEGRISVVASLFWGIASVMAVRIISPLFHKLYKKIKTKKSLHAILITLTVYVLICYILKRLIFPGKI